MSGCVCVVCVVMDARWFGSEFSLVGTAGEARRWEDSIQPRHSDTTLIRTLYGRTHFHSHPPFITMASSPSNLDSLTAEHLDNLITRSLAEDVHTGDVTTESTIPIDSVSTASFLAKEDGILSGIEVATVVFRRVDPSLKVDWTKKDGEPVTKGTYFGTTHGR